MGFWVFMLILVLLVPLIMIGLGAYYKNHPPKKINWIAGYRTARSMRSKEAWDYAHRHFGRLWVNFGWILLPLSAAAMLFALGKDGETVGLFGAAVCLMQVLAIILSMIPTEIALKRTFGDDGKRQSRPDL